MNNKAKIIAVMNNKGGVLKTTIATNFASLLATQGKRTLIIDLDPQANVSTSFGINPNEFKTTISEVLINNIDLDQSIQPNIIPNLDLCPTNDKLSQFVEKTYLELQENQKVKLNVLLKYDYIIIDSSPHLDLLMKNIIAASCEILIPFQMEVLAARGLINLIN